MSALLARPSIILMTTGGMSANADGTKASSTKPGHNPGFLLPTKKAPLYWGLSSFLKVMSMFQARKPCTSQAYHLRSVLSKCEIRGPVVPYLCDSVRTIQQLQAPTR